MAPFGLTTPESQEAQPVATRKRFRPLSPPTTGDEPTGLTDNDTLPAKRHKTTTRPTSPPPLMRNVSKKLVTPTKKQGVFGSGLSKNRAKGTSVRPLSAAGGFEDTEGVEAVRRITPDRRERSLTPLLASSRRVMPRPRPPSRNPSPLKPSRAPHHKAVEDGDDEDLMPPGSPKTYFSSPASSTSSASREKGVQSPGSPLLVPNHFDPNFTMNQESFVPLFTSTQNGPEGDGSGGAGCGRTSSRKDSLGLFKFNSQFDVDGKVDDTIALLEKDMDMDNWFTNLGEDVDLTVGEDD